MPTSRPIAHLVPLKPSAHPPHTIPIVLTLSGCMPTSGRTCSPGIRLSASTSISRLSSVPGASCALFTVSGGGRGGRIDSPPPPMRWPTLHRHCRGLALAWKSTSRRADLCPLLSSAGPHTHTLFVGFNGTAGVWRLEAIDQAGGWHADTTVEDMDLSARAYAKGWTFK